MEEGRGQPGTMGSGEAGFPKALRGNWQYMELRQAQVSIWQFQ